MKTQESFKTKETQTKDKHWKWETKVEIVHIKNLKFHPKSPVKEAQQQRN